MFELKGTIKEIHDEKTFGSGFNKREFVITTDHDRYPQEVKFETVKDNTKKLADCKPGEVVTVCFDIRGREYNGNYYVNLAAWRIIHEVAGDGLDQGQPAPLEPRPPQEPQRTSKVLPGVIEEPAEEEVPF